MSGADVVDTTDPASTEADVRFRQELTAAGGEGMVVKPFANLVKVSRGYAQPGIKVHGPEYLRIIYGPDYTKPAILGRRRERGPGHQPSLAARSYALGVEAFERAVQRQPLWWVHEAVFAVLALESEPVDPRRCRTGCRGAAGRCQRIGRPPVTATRAPEM